MSRDKKPSGIDVQSAFDKVMTCKGKTPKTCTNPGLTKMDICALAMLIDGVDRKIREYEKEIKKLKDREEQYMATLS